MAEGEDHDLLIEMRGDIKHIRQEVGDIKDRMHKGDRQLREHDREISRLDACQKSTDEKVDKHSEGHRWFAGAMIGLASLAVTIILAVAKYVGVI